MVRYAIAHLDDIDELADQGYRYRPVRHHFGITSFGVTAWTAQEAGDAVIATTPLAGNCGRPWCPSTRADSTPTLPRA
jgi:hypothetical protein